MKLGLLLVAVLASASSTPVQGKSERLMDEIEKQVRLPERAPPLKQYARHYAFDTKGKVIGVYVLRPPIPPREPDYGCEEIVLDGDDLPSKPVPCPPEPDTSNDVAAGDRRWLDDYRKLPLINDGGCMVVNVIFNPSTNKVEDAFCNGVA